MVPLVFQWSTGFPAKTKSRKTRILFFVVILLFLNLNYVNAQGVAVVPNELNFDENQKEITIYNLNEAEAEYLVYAKSNPEIFEIKPEKVLIEKGSSKKIKIILKEKKAFDDIIYIKEINENKNFVSGIGIRAFRKKEFYDGKEICIACLVLLGGVLVYYQRGKSSFCSKAFFFPATARGKRRR